MKYGMKIVKWLLVVVLVLVVSVAILINLFGYRTLKFGIQRGGSSAMKVGVRVNDVTLKILAGKLNLNNLEVDNPEGYEHKQLLSLGNAFVAVNIGSLMSDTVEIDQVRLDNISLTIEQKGTTNNLQQILNNLPKSDAPIEPTDKSGKPGKHLKIKELQINGVQVIAKLLPIPGRADTVTLKVAPITLTDLGTNEELDMAKLTAVILKAIARGVAEQGKGLLPTDMLSGLGKDLLGTGQKVLEESMEAGKGAIQGASETIKGIFKKKE